VHDPNGNSLSLLGIGRIEWLMVSVKMARVSKITCRDNDVCFPEKIALNTCYCASLHGRYN